MIALHPWNVGFTWEDRTGPFRRLVDEQVAAFDRDGYLVVPDVLDADTLAEVVATIDGFEAEADAFLGGRDGGRLVDRRAGRDHVLGPSRRQVVAARRPRSPPRSSSISAPT